jgi:hypothetical protein
MTTYKIFGTGHVYLLLGAYRTRARASAFWQGSDSIWINMEEHGVFSRPEWNADRCCIVSERLQLKRHG